MVNKILTVFLFSLLLFSSYAGGPWVQKKGHSYLQFGGGVIPSTGELFFQSTSVLSLNREITDISFGFYGEYGITNKLSLIVDLPYKVIKSSKELNTLINLPILEAGTLHGFSNIHLTPKYQFHNKTIVISGGIDFSLPTGISEFSTGLKTGDQTTGIMPILDIGYSKNKFYTFTEIGYNYRTKLTNDAHITVEGGYKIFKEVYVILNFNILLSELNTNTTSGFNEPTGLYTDGQEYSALTLKLSSPIKNNIGINMHVTLLNFHGHLVQRSPSIGGSIYLKLKGKNNHKKK